MTKIILVLCFCLCILMSGCASNQKQEQPTEKLQEETETLDDKNTQITKGKKDMDKKLTLTINNSIYDVTLYDTPAANALFEMLPLDLTFEDFNNIEKIAYLEESLPTEDEPDGFDPNIGDLCLYAPWGNLSIFYKDFRYSDSLISLGHIDTGMEDISNLSNNFSARLEIKK